VREKEKDKKKRKREVAGALWSVDLYASNIVMRIGDSPLNLEHSLNDSVLYRCEQIARMYFDKVNKYKH